MQAKRFAIVGLALLVSCTGSNGDADPVATGQGCKQEVVIYLHVSATPARRARVGVLLEDRSDVEKLVFHSPEEAYKEFKRNYRNQPEIYKDRSPADFPGSFEVTLTPGTTFDDFEASLVGTPGVDKLLPGPCTEGAR